jgi:hypothetical protein
MPDHTASHRNMRIDPATLAKRKNGRKARFHKAFIDDIADLQVMHA